MSKGTTIYDNYLFLVFRARAGLRGVSVFLHLFAGFCGILRRPYDPLWSLPHKCFYDESPNRPQGAGSLAGKGVRVAPGVCTTPCASRVHTDASPQCLPLANPMCLPSVSPNAYRHLKPVSSFSVIRPMVLLGSVLPGPVLHYLHTSPSTLTYIVCPSVSCS